MKFILATVCLLVGSAVTQYNNPYNNPYNSPYNNNPYNNNAYARFGPGAVGRPDIPILAYSNDVNPDGSYQYSYQTGNGISAQQQGYTRNLGAGPEAEANTVQGSYSYTGPDGVVYTVNYVADENGYRASGGHLPTQPAVATGPAGPFQPGYQGFPGQGAPFRRY